MKYEEGKVNNNLSLVMGGFKGMACWYLSAC